mmetsp:Transcript_65286/g.142184  ORF Transcript_65286/g.142184 Transcript_65286/m.142184 type:complete len:445 (+) Transcript_65286:2153-3487(+)
MPEEAPDVGGVASQPSELSGAIDTGAPIPDADRLVVATRREDLSADGMKGHIEDPCVMPRHLHDRRDILGTPGLNVEDPHDAILTPRSQDIVLSPMPRNTDHCRRMFDPADVPGDGVNDAGIFVSTTGGDLSRTIRGSSLAPLTTESLACVYWQPQDLLAIVGAPDKENASAAHRADSNSARPPRQAVQELVLPGVEFLGARHCGDPPDLHMPIVRGCRYHVGIVRVEGDIEDCFRVPRLRGEAHCSRGDVADTDRAIFVRQHKPVRLTRYSLDAVHASGTDLDLHQRRPLRYIPYSEHPNPLGTGDKVARLRCGPCEGLDALRLLVKAVDLRLRAGIEQGHTPVRKGCQEIILRQRIPLGVSDRVLRRLCLPSDEHLLPSALVVNRQRAIRGAQQNPAMISRMPPEHLRSVRNHGEELRQFLPLFVFPELDITAIEGQDDLAP